MTNANLLDKYTALTMQLQEEYSAEKQNYTLQHTLENEYKRLRKQILAKMK